MKTWTWVAGPLLGGLLLCAGPASTMAAFTAGASDSNSVSAISLPVALPLALTSVTVPNPKHKKTGVGQTISVGTVSDAIHETLTPSVSLTGVPGVTLDTGGATMAYGDSIPLIVDGVPKLKPGVYTATVTVSLGGFTESGSVTLTVKKPELEKALVSPSVDPSSQDGTSSPDLSPSTVPSTTPSSNATTPS